MTSPAPLRASPGRTIFIRLIGAVLVLFTLAALWLLVPYGIHALTTNTSPPAWRYKCVQSTEERTAPSPYMAYKYAAPTTTTRTCTAYDYVCTKGRDYTGPFVCEGPKPTP